MKIKNINGLFIGVFVSAVGVLAAVLFLYYARTDAVAFLVAVTIIVGVIIVIYSLTVAHSSPGGSIKCLHADNSSEKPNCDPKVIDSLWKEHESFMTAIHQRGTGNLLTNSILITGSLVLLGGILAASNTHQGELFLQKVRVPLFVVLEFLIIAAWYWFESVTKVNVYAHRRVQGIEECLKMCKQPVQGQKWLRSELERRWWYQIRFSIVWRGLFSVLLITTALVLFSI